MSALFPILIVGLAVAGERGLRVAENDFDQRGWPVAVMLLGSIVIALCSLATVITICERRMQTRPSWVHIDRADRALRVTQWTCMIAYAVAVSTFGWVPTVQNALGGDVIALDLLITVLPPVVGLTATWWIHYPIVNRIRHATVLRTVDHGGIMPEIPGRWRYTNVQMRAQLLFLLVPLLIMATAGEAIDALVPIEAPDDESFYVNQSLWLVAAFVTFTLAPLMVRVLLHVQSMPRGPLRDDLVAVCSAHGVRVRDVLLWRTDGTMMNAAVMGLFGFARYVLITDALLESMRREQVIAVMAHEVGHVRRHHMPWMLIALMAVLLPLSILAAWAAMLAEARDVELFLSGAALVPAFFAFGWVSRRFERQADTFAVQHLSGLRRSDAETARQPVAPEAIAAMQMALERIARLNAMNPKRRSWRHGSIRWRQAYLATLEGRPLNRLAVDRHVRVIKLVALIALLGSLVVLVWNEIEFQRALTDRRDVIARALR